MKNGNKSQNNYLSSKGIISGTMQSYTSTEVSSGMMKETNKDKVIIRSHFKSGTQDEIDMQVAEILARLINRELETIR